MLIIRPMHKFFLDEISTWHQETEDQGVRQCRYVVVSEIDNGLLLWNTLTLGLVWINNLSVKDWTDNHLDSNLISLLRSQWFYVPVFFNEPLFLKHLLCQYKKVQAKRTKYTILTTLYCNANCAYCYERHGDFIRKSMTDSIAHKVAKFVNDTRKGNKIKLEWIGGEPLLNPNAIDLICGDLRNYEINFESSLVSNGLLLNEDLINQALNRWNLKSIQITIDGTEKVYNDTKNYSGDIANPFNNILNNIAEIFKANIYLSIRLNLSYTNVHDLERLIWLLIKSFPDKSQYLIYVSLLEQEMHCDNQEKLRQNLSNWIYLNKILSDEGFIQWPLDSNWPINKCIADNENCHVISPVGNLYRCEEISATDVIGHIDTGITNSKKVAKWKITNKTCECDDCLINPVCLNLLNCPADLECNSLTKSIDICKRIFAMKAEYCKFKNNQVV